MDLDRVNKGNVKLINFNVPVYLLTNFDNLARHKATSRTSMLLQLMERFVRDESDWLEKDNRLNAALMEIEWRNQKRMGIRIKEAVRDLVRQERDDEPPAPMGWGAYNAF
jgi:metal-responsive CopG/Arc/MetJ family transcriptional regulator